MQKMWSKNLLTGLYQKNYININIASIRVKVTAWWIDISVPGSERLKDTGIQVCNVMHGDSTCYVS